MHLLLHIGPPKTGSTAIQKSLFQNRGQLDTAGILLFPEERGDLPQRALSTKYSMGGGPHKGSLRRRFDNPEEAQVWSAAQWDVLSSVVRDSPADLCVISSEHFGYRMDVPALVTAYRDIFTDITVLAYARDPVSLFFSLLQQNLRGGAPLQRAPTPRSFKYRLRAILEQYQTVLGSENIVVRNFARDNLCGGDVAQDFFHQFERFGKTVTVDPVRANESLPGAALALLMLMNETLVPGGKDQQRLQTVRRLTKSETVRSLASFKPGLPQADALIRARTAEDCDWFNRNFLSGQVPLAVEHGPIEVTFSDAEWREQMRDMLLGFLTPEALAVLGREVIRL